MQDTNLRPLLQDSGLRMAFMASNLFCGFSMMIGRTAIPFNPMLGETYELITPVFRMITECVS